MVGPASRRLTPGSSLSGQASAGPVRSKQVKVLLRRLARRRLETSLVVAQIALGSVFRLGAVSWLLRQAL